ncbi:peptide chain release factor N(5)-glutamine methyltransferase [Novosphingobium sp.]|uniref:peptide chain release factor N(5)-glutamine methyltransferase n=1 Tax=Novosphingobium sp. TaxID=1874826 RepID=UPI002734ED54|nr:peptide chain release factor N(5)-glutamine methyltransferase [Novosphingobium sp.]MDP3908261.1 peptide chain release factor N(5)-glutamine methyltransferase [Novosphingobium sp.]
MTAADAIRAATAALAQTSDTARLDAEVLMAHALGVTRSELLLRHMRDAVPATFAALIERRQGHEPVAYIVGEQEFFGLPFRVSPAVLIPRGDSEVLVEAALAARPDAARVLDCGTGSGALLLAVLHELPGATGVGIDRSAAALAVASANAQALGLANRAMLVQADWHSAGWADALGGPFDLVLANPPYVEDAADLAASVRAHEPAGALFAGADGLDDYRVLVPQLPTLLAPGGAALVEIGYTQAEAVTAMAVQAGMTAGLHRDLGGRARVLEIKIPLGKGSATA